MREEIVSNPGHIEHAELLYTMHELSRLIGTHFDKAVTALQLTHAQWWALMHVFENEGATQTELAAIMQMGRPSIGKLLDRLEQKHWIARRSDPSDSRVKRVYMGEAAIPVFSRMNAEGHRLFGHFLKGIAPEEEQRLIEGLRKIRANAEAPAQPLAGAGAP